jgi:hypothetical protein
MHIIADSADSLVCTLANDCEIEINCSFVDMTSSATTPGHEHARSAGSAGDYDICPAPSASTQRIVKAASIYNADSTEVASLEIWHSAGGSERKQLTLTLLRGESLHYEDGRGWYRIGPTESGTYSGRSVGFLKFGTGADTVGYFYCHSKDVGFPGAFAVGTPGLGGRTTDGTTSTDAGCLVVPNAATGGNFLTSFELSSTVAHFYWLIDVLWCNSGTVVTTTTGQTVNSGTLPARDANGTTDGEGCMIGLLFTTAATNAAVINNATVTYTNSDGTGGRTATLANRVGAQIPVSPVGRHDRLVRAAGWRQGRAKHPDADARHVARDWRRVAPDRAPGRHLFVDRGEHRQRATPANGPRHPALERLVPVPVLPSFGNHRDHRRGQHHRSGKGGLIP